MISSALAFVLGIVLRISGLDTASAMIAGMIAALYFMLLGNNFDSASAKKDIREMRDNLASLEEFSPILNSLMELSRTVGRFRERGLELLRDFQRVVEGHYFIRGYPAEEWEEHEKCMAHLQQGEWFRATCYIPAHNEGIDRLFAFHEYESYCLKSYDLPAKRGVNLQKIFLIPNSEAMENAALQAHFALVRRLVDKYSRELAQSGVEFAFRVLDASKVRELQLPNVLQDYMIWGETMVSISVMGDDTIVTKLDVHSGPDKTKEYLDRFARTWQYAVPIDNVCVGERSEQKGNSNE